MTEKRLLFIVVLFTAFVFLIELNMVHINISGRYSEKAENQQTRKLAVDDGRGVITDTNFDNITNTQTAYKTLVTAYDNDLQQVFNVMTQKEKQNFYDNIQYKTNFIASITQPVKGREIYTTTNRYTDFNIAQHLVGYTDGEGNGIAGMEQVFDSQLKNASAVRYINTEINGYGQIVSRTTEKVVENDVGYPTLLSLTIDNRIQRICEGLAKEYIPNGSIVVMESDTGKIRAMVSTPFYSANNVAASLEMENSPLVNKAMQSYQAGSVIKPLWSAVLLENGYNPSKIYNCTGSTEINGHIYHCANDKAHGEVDMEMALTVSCNCYFIDAYIRNKGYSFYNTAKSVMLGEKLTLTNSYSTKSGYFPTIEEIADLGQLASISFGQGKMMVTPIHITAYMNIFATEGKYIVPQIAEGIYNADSRECVTQLYNYSARQVITAETAQQIKSMLQNVVQEGAMGRAAPQYLSAGGKTGTAQTGSSNEKGEEILTAWFCGFIPKKIRNTQSVLQCTTAEKVQGQPHRCLKKYATVCTT